MRVLIIRPGAIGDSLLTLPVLEALKERYPTASLSFVSNRSVLSLALATGLVEEVSDYQHPMWSELFSAAGITTPNLQSQLRQVDLAICWLRDPDNLVEKNLLAAGVRQVILAPGRPPASERIHIIQYLARTLGLQNIETNTGIKFNLPATSDTYPESIAIHPGSGSAQKCWPASSFAAVIKRLALRSMPMLLLSGPADAGITTSILSTVVSELKPELLKVLENVPLLEVASRLQHCKCYLGNDSGITHLAAMLGVPTIVLFGPSDPVIWRPFGPFVLVLQEPNLDQLPVERVMEALNKYY